ncbi:MAG: LPS export ABC transporter periplasmic protein LptC [Bacteriovoracia bacterium]
MAHSVKLQIGQSKVAIYDPAQNQGATRKSYFKELSYLVMKEWNPFIKLNAKVLTMDSISKLTDIEKPKGTIYVEGQSPIFYKADNGQINQQLESIKLKDNAVLNRDKMQLNAKNIEYVIRNDRFSARTNVKTKLVNEKNGDTLHISSDRAVAYPSIQIYEFHGDVAGKIVRKRIYERSIYFWCEFLYCNMNKDYARLQKSVKIKHGTSVATAIRGEIYLDNYNKKLKYYTLFDDVKIVEEYKNERGKLEERIALGEKLDVYHQQRKAVLTGAPRVYQGEDVIKGNKITIRENMDLIEVDDSQSVFEIK